MNSIKLWGGIISSPVDGFSKVDAKTKIALPILLIILLALISTTLLLGIMSNDGYKEALLRTQIVSFQEKGTELSSEQMAAMEKQFNSPTFMVITAVSTVGGGVITYVLMTAVSLFLLKLISLIFKQKAGLKILLRIFVYIALFSIAQMLLKNIITLVSDYGRILARVQSTDDLRYALTSSISLAALFDPSSIGKALHYAIDLLTDVFNWLYYGFLYAGLRGAAKIEKKTALTITIVFALVMSGIGLLMTVLI